MKLNLFVVALALFVSACSSPAEQEREEQLNVQRLNSQLPAGCFFKYLGNYDRYPVMMIYCDGKETVSTNNVVPGKSSYPSMTVTIDGKQFELKPKEGASE